MGLCSLVPGQSALANAFGQPSGGAATDNEVRSFTNTIPQDYSLENPTTMRGAELMSNTRYTPL